MHRSIGTSHSVIAAANRALVAHWRLPDASDETSLDAVGVLMEFEPNCEIYTLEDSADHIYKVVSGAVRTYQLLNDGRRHIAAFYLGGDVFGFESGPTRAFSCDTVCASTIRMISYSTLERAISHGRIDRVEMLAIAAKEMERAQVQSSLLIKTASERVVTFLLQMCAQSMEPATFQLPMSRQDIADYLGLTIETVSRVLTQLEDSGVILRTPLKRIVVRDMRALEQMTV